jgi:transketolase
MRMGVKNRFGTAGSEEMLKKEFGLDSESLAVKVEKFLNNK